MFLYHINSRLIDIQQIKSKDFFAKTIDKEEMLLYTNRVKNLLEEQKYNLKIGDYVEFKHSNEIIKGFIEDTYYSHNQSITNIEINQFTNENSWGNYILKGVSLSYIRGNILVHKESLINDDLIVDKDILESFLAMSMCVSKSVHLEEKFAEINKFSKKEIEEKVLKILKKIGYIPTEIKFGEPEKGILGEIKVPVYYNQVEAMNNWNNLSSKKIKNMQTQIC